MVTLHLSRYVVPVTSPPFEQGGIVVKDGWIVEIGARETLQRKYPCAGCHDYGEAILLPAFSNAHCHLELSHYPQWAEEVGEATIRSVGFTGWILRLIRVKKALGYDLERYRQSWHAGLQQTLASGTALIGDILATTALAADAAAHLAGRCFIEVIGQDSERVYQQWQHLDHCLSTWPAAHWGAAPHSPYTLDIELLKQGFRYTTSKHLRSSIHLAESADEIEFMQDSTGPIAEKLYPMVGWQRFLPAARRLRPIQLLEQSGGLHPDTLLVHGVHLNREEIAKIAAAGCAMVLCPRSNAQLNVGVAPIGDYLRAGVPLALGTDSLASNQSLSLWDEMAFAQHWFHGDVSSEQLVWMATLGGAQALGFGRTGRLAAGAAATFQIVRPGQLPELNQIYPFLCQAQRSHDVELLVFEGEKRWWRGAEEIKNDQQSL